MSGFKAYVEAVDVRKTPQSEPVYGKEQIKNSGGGYVFAVDDWTRLDRFLILGSDSPTYYAGSRELTRENAAAVERCMQLDGEMTVARIVDVSVSGRAPKNDPAVFALALCLARGNTSTKEAARNAIAKVCRIPTHLFQLLEAYKALGGGFGRGTKRAFANWYLDKPLDRLAYQVVKYQKRNGWSHKDALRVAHPKTNDPSRNALFRYLATSFDDGPRKIVSKEGVREYGRADFTLLPEVVAAAEGMKLAITPYSRENPKHAIRLATGLIKAGDLPREAVPTELLNFPEVWDALLHGGSGMPLTAMIRNLGKMTQVGLIQPMSDASRYIREQLGNAEALKKARVHPFSILLAMKTYASGRGVRGSLTWNPDRTIVDALNNAFYGAFANVEPTGLRHLLALDVSGSMDWTQTGSSITSREAAAALSLVTAKTENEHHIVGFTSKTWLDPAVVSPLNISPNSRLDDVVRYTQGLPFGGTDCALPMQYALKNKIPVDVFVIYTDNETWAGKTHPFQALKQYREQMGIPAKLIVAAFASNNFSIADPSDAGMLDVAGLDAAVPEVMRNFIIQ